MLTLLTFPGAQGMPSHSPFCLKAMCLLHMSGEAWDVEYIQDLSTMPLGRVPVLRVGDQVIPDSHNIQSYLESLGHCFDTGLSKIELAQSHMLIRTVEESLRLGLVHDRWLHPDVWPIMSDILFAPVPAEIRPQIKAEAKSHVEAGLFSQGISRFSEADRLTRLGKDMDAVATALDDKAFLFGSAPTSADAAIAPVLDMILQAPAPTGLRKLAEAKASFKPYVERVRAAIYPIEINVAALAA